MRILVTGGAGYIGSTLVPAMLDAGHEVVVVDRFYFGQHTLDDAVAAHPGAITVVRGDVRRPDPSLFRGTDCVVDLASISNDPSCELDPTLSRSINVDGTMATAATARAAGVSRFVFASSCAVYGHGQQPQLTEESPARPVSLCARYKLEAEQGLLARTPDGMSLTCLRLATLFGVSRRMRFDLAVNVMTKNAYLRQRITVDGGGRQWRPFVHVEDVARCILLVLEAPTSVIAGRVFNVGSDDNNLRIMNLAYRVRDKVPGTRVEHVSTDPDLRDYNVSFERVSRELGFKAMWGIDQGIQELLEALRNGSIDPLDRRGYTREQYEFLKEVERSVSELALGGTVLQ